MSKKRMIKLIMGLGFDKRGAEFVSHVAYLTGQNYKNVFDDFLEYLAGEIPDMLSYKCAALETMRRYKAGEITAGQAVKKIGTINMMLKHVIVVDRTGDKK